MKVTGETFSFYHKRKGTEEVRYQKYWNFQVKEPLPDRTLESFILKSTEGATPNLLGKPIQSLLKENYLNFLGRIFQVKGQSKNSNITIFILSFFIFY